MVVLHVPSRRGPQGRSSVSGRARDGTRETLDARYRRPARGCLSMGLLGILIALGLLIWLAYRGWSILLLAPAAAILAAALAGGTRLSALEETVIARAAPI